MSFDKSELDETAINNFREYLRIPSVHPNINYDDCVTFVKKQAESLSLPVRVFEPIPKKPMVVITWEGTEPEKSSIFLNGHMDVVPVFSDKWKHPPFDAHMDENGDIYARGTQDMKNLSIQFVEAVRRLKLNGVRLKRTIHICFSSDEEIGSEDGMKAFVKTQDFKNLNVGFGLDEGTAFPIEPVLLFYGERSKWNVWVHCPGKPGHGCMVYENTSGEKFHKIIDRFMKFRDSENARLQDSNLKPGDVTSVNLTMVQGGVQINVNPDQLSVAFDIRVAPDVDHQEFKNQIQKWCEEAGEGVYFTLEGEDPAEVTKLDDSNPFWVAFKQACDDSNIHLMPIICPGGTDARSLRKMGIPAFGFTPANNTPTLLHQNDEYLNKDVFLKGIEIFMNVIPAVANV